MSEPEQGDPTWPLVGAKQRLVLRRRKRKEQWSDKERILLLPARVPETHLLVAAG